MHFCTFHAFCMYTFESVLKLQIQIRAHHHIDVFTDIIQGQQFILDISPNWNLLPIGSLQSNF